MSLNEIATKYLETFERNEEFPDGLSFRDALVDANLDYSFESLARIDKLLDNIRREYAPQYSAFIKDYAHQSFLYLLAFYVGTVVARKSGNKITWYDYNEMVTVLPDNRNLVPQCFASSITCVIEKKGFFIPLSAIQDRLFEEDSGKGVSFSAGAFI